ncbi:N-acyl-D-amino-acid deacylase family protein [Dermatobacter hominis]|uniref:N-acyl-D-amino-acid deacylase family protein n=1 Tax=Dermatobacter hominis TaxID=2884263 RepID=UPI001D1293BE|nr:amidohydrolase family protein [Dermatobacter hominis]UDY34785.1 amidohydrolase family protein [Dermatobacter hominis]
MTTVIRGGLVVDGTGAEGRVADVLIEDGTVAAIGRDLEVPAGAEVIEADGCWVTPGFIDLHTHYDAELEFDPALEESVRHGVTTVLIGSCGLSFAVGDPEDLADMFCRVEGVPRADVLPMLDRLKDWETPAEYLDHLDSLPLGPNVCSFLGHSAMRAAVMGLGRSLDDDVEPTPGELGRMVVMLDEALDAGYLGLSINTLPWDKMDGDRYRSRPTPSVFASWKEYRRLAAVLRARDAVFEGVPDISGRWNLIFFAGIASGIGRKPLRTTIISLMDVKAAPGSYKVFAGAYGLARRWLKADVRLQALPQAFRLWTDGLENPVLEEIGAGTEALHLAEQAARSDLLRDPSYRERFRKQWTNRFKGRAYHRDLSEARIVECPDPSVEGMTFAEVAAKRGSDPVDTFLDLAAEHGNHLRWTTTVGNTDDDAVAWIVENPQAQIGFSDAGAHLRNMAFYNFPLHLLRLVRRRRDQGRPVLPLGRAVHRVTGELADYLGIDAGRLQVGARADVVVIEPDALDDRVDEVVEASMPGIGSVRRLVNRGEGAVKAVLVNGRVAWDGGGRAEGFGAEPGYGRLLRSTRT